ncbi:MAG: diguanylate cyclase [Candidatus Ancaeobacter aquaticus]|nr:diguanylate cyclase [Candidatus Ancaeobacter aquaticus]
MKPKRLKKLIRVITAIFFLLFITYAFILAPFDIITNAKLKTLDVFFRLSHVVKPLPSQINDIVVVAIDDVSLQQANRKWPWDRDVYATMVNTIKKGEPKVIGFDIIFIGESADRKNDTLFKNALKETGNIVLASYYSDNGEHILPHAPFLEAARSHGPINKPRDMDYRVRNTRLFIRDKKGSKDVIEYSFGVKILCEYYGCDQEDIFYNGKAVLLRKKGTPEPLASIPVRSDGTAKINYLADTKNFTIIPAWRILNGKFNIDEVKGKIVLIGQTNEIIHDVYPTPLMDMPGVLMNANSILTVLSKRYIKTVPPIVDSVILILFSIIAVLIAYKFTAIKGFIFIVVEIISFLTVSAFLFYKNYIGDFFSVLFCIVIIYIAVIFYKYIRLLLESMELKQDAITDGLTGLYIMRYFSLRLQNEFERAKRYDSKLSLVMMDIDHFKKFNDTYGHEKGNIVLKGVAETMRDTFRKSDILVRYGGEEFCALLPGVGRGEAFESAERFRRRLFSIPFHIDGDMVHVSVSVGLVSFPDTFIDTSKDFIEFADQALYKAKNAGRNKTIYFNPKVDTKNKK